MAVITALSAAQADVVSAIASASTGDTVIIPAGSATWGAGGTSVTVNKAITLQGSGTANTIITPDATGPSQFSAGIIIISANAVIRDFALVFTPSIASFSLSSAPTAFRVTNILWNGANATGASTYFLTDFGGGGAGVIDNCILNPPSAANESVYIRGATNSWQVPSTKGSPTQVVYIENCTFGAIGTVCDYNSNGRGCIRNCLFPGNGQKVDGHGYATNTPPRSYRHLEVYNNTYSFTGGSNTNSAEFRGGSTYFFNNLLNHPILNAVYFEDYGYQDPRDPRYGNVWQTPAFYPLPDQVGTGIDPPGYISPALQVGALEPAYSWGNLAKGNGTPLARSFKNPNAGLALTTDTSGYSIGATNIYLSGSGIVYPWDALAIGVDPVRYQVTTQMTFVSAAGSGGGGSGFVSGASTVVGGVLTALAVSNGGTGYTSPPTLVISGSGTGATATANLTGTAVTSITITAGGTGYNLVTLTVPLSTSIAASAVAVADTPQSLYQWQTGNSSSPYYNPAITQPVTFGENDVIMFDRDLFWDTAPASFTGASGVGVGTFAAMNALTAGMITAGYAKPVGFFCTDQGADWQATPVTTTQGVATTAKKSGVLYSWTGSSWKNIYTPYVYPHPLVSGRSVASAFGVGRAVEIFTP
jgi:hypothetical protein